MDETRDAVEGIYPLSPRQLAQLEGDEGVVELFGKYDQGIGEAGAHYVAASPFAGEGMVCASCAFYEGPRACEIVDGDIDPGGICKRWIIPEQLLTIGQAQGPADTTGDAVPDTPAPIRYSILETEERKVNGRAVEYRTFEVGPLELRDNQGGEGMHFVGYAAVFNSPSEPLPFTETISPGAFKRSLNSGREVRAFVNHDTNTPLATTRNGSLRLSEDARGLKAEIDLPDTTAGRDLAELVRTGTVHSMSFAFSVPAGGDAWSQDRSSRDLRELILHEVSPVTGFPAYPETSGATVRSTDEVAADDEERTYTVALAQRILVLNAKR